MAQRFAQYYIAFVFFALGGWALFLPGNVIDLAFTEAAPLEGGPFVTAPDATLGTASIGNGFRR